MSQINLLSMSKTSAVRFRILLITSFSSTKRFHCSADLNLQYLFVKARVWSVELFECVWICSDNKMFVDNRLTFLGLVFILSCSTALRQYGTPGKTLYVAEDPDTASGKLTVIERYASEASPSLERSKRQAATLNSPAVQKNISTWVSW